MGVKVRPTPIEGDGAVPIVLKCASLEWEVGLQVSWLKSSVENSNCNAMYWFNFWLKHFNPIWAHFEIQRIWAQSGQIDPMAIPQF